MQLNSLTNTTRPYKRRRRVGRGIGSGLGKTCARGHKGAGSRSGWKKRERYEGGQIPLYRKLPIRGFSRARFQKKLDVINLGQIDLLFTEGEVVSTETLKAHGFLKGVTNGVKILSEGELTKKLRFEVEAISASAEEKLKKAGISYTIV
ncbi:MAG: rplO [Chlamydiia bacterium]|nr:rplO [Chlamydiia bacterium]